MSRPVRTAPFRTARVTTFIDYPRFSRPLSSYPASARSVASSARTALADNPQPGVGLSSERQQRVRAILQPLAAFISYWSSRIQVERNRYAVVSALTFQGNS